MTISEEVRRLSLGRNIKPTEEARNDLLRLWIDGTLPPGAPDAGPEYHEARWDYKHLICTAVEDEGTWRRFMEKHGNDDIGGMLDAYIGGVPVEDITA